MFQDTRSLLGKRISTLTGELAANEGLLPGFGQGDQGGAAEPKLTETATDDEALNPAAGSAGWTKRYNPFPSACLPGGAEEGGRKGVAGVAAGGLGLGSDRSEVAYSIPDSRECGASA